MRVEQAWEEWKADRKEQWRKDKLASDAGFLLHFRMAALLRRFLGSRKGGDRTFEILGYTKNQLVRHFERQFLPEMGWHNAARWHVDHIVPLAEFKCQSVDDPEFKAAWALSNLRPIWAEENLRKGAKRIFLV
jgi:5-methylcytosine-specific restriction endonuclease McrA